MATSFRIEHTFPAPVDVVLRHHMDEALHQACNEALSSAERVLESKEEREDGSVVQRFRVKATADIPAAARKALKPEMLEWIEESVWHPDTQRFTWEIQPYVMRDKLRAAGELWYEPEGQETRRIVTGTIEIRIPIAGKVAEKVIVSSLKRSYEETAVAESRYYGEKAREAS